jgi:Domain of unknown function (DU1801)
MAKVELKTNKTEASIEDFINSITDETVREDCKIIAEMMSKATDSPAKMWGTNIVGFGSQHLKYESGRELDWLIIGFSPRKTDISLYGITLKEDLLAKLGKHKTGKSCLYIKNLSNIDLEVLKEMIKISVK